MRRILILIHIFCEILIYSRIASAAVMPVVIDTTSFKEQACIRYDTDFTVDVMPNVWEAVIERPMLLGALWEGYGFEPPYAIEKVGGAVHVVDGSGLEGYLSSAGGDLTTRVLMARGRLRNWGLPIGVKGRALFILHWQSHEESVDVRLDIYGEGTGSAADVIIRAFSPILRYFINRRISSNLRDLSTILDDIAHHPDVARDKLDINYRPEFESLSDSFGVNSE